MTNKKPIEDAPIALIVGLGVVGLPLALRLAQAGWRLLLCDGDFIEERNLTKQLWNDAQVGRPKVVATAELIRRHAPDAWIGAFEGDVRCLGFGVFDQVSLAAACVDNRAAERHVARMAALAGTDYLRLATRGETRVADITFVPGPSGPEDPCGLCNWSAGDFVLADLRESCFDELEANPDAGALTFAEHGTIAAAIAADALLRGELRPARMVRFTGGVSPEMTTTSIPWSPGCRSTGDVRGVHGPIEHQTLERGAQDLRLGELMDQACSRLQAPPQQIMVELDAPFCALRVCSKSSCRATSTGFRVYGPVICDRCGRPLIQEAQKPVSRIELSALAAEPDRTPAQLGAPVGAGLRMTASGAQRRTWDVCLSVDVSDFLLNPLSETEGGQR